MRDHVTAQLLWDGTFSTEAVAAAGLARLDQLHAEAMATIAALAENWDQPADPARPAGTDHPAGDEATSWSDPESWSAEDDELPAEDDDEADEAPVLVLAALPPLPPLLRRPRLAPNVTAPAAAEDARQLASA
jgi:hypothetical protein